MTQSFKIAKNCNIEYSEKFIINISYIILDIIINNEYYRIKILYSEEIKIKIKEFLNTIVNGNKEEYLEKFNNGYISIKIRESVYKTYKDIVIEIMEEDGSMFFNFNRKLIY